MMRTGSAASLAAVGVAAMALGASAPGAGRVTTGPVARYQMDVSTTSGFGGLGGGHVNPMSMMFGGGGSGGAHHSLLLRLGSSLAPTGGAPNADHFMPAGADLGSSVPLVTPQHRVTPETPEEESDAPPNFQRPKGRMLIFWGCGAHAGPGQPVVIDFSKLAQGQMPPHLFSSDVPREIGPTEANSRTFGEWPNAKSRKTLSERSSLLGGHSVKGNYSPDIQFTLNQDFMAALHASSRDAPDGSVPMSWNAVPAATGYYATLFGGRNMGNGGGDVVMWSSAARREIGGGLSDWLAPATVNRLIAQHIVMSPTQTNCTVPAEVKQAAGQFMMVQLYAYGPEADFAYPPRPSNPKTPWHIQWTAKARYKSTTGLMLGMQSMDSMSRDDASDNDNRRDEREREKRCKPHGLGGLLKSAAGIGC